MNQYYQEIITKKSWLLLQKLRKEIDFVLIGGWAVYLYTKGLKSKDIDIVFDYQELGKIKKHYEVSKNTRLKKYEIKKEGIDIDIYLPFFSFLGLPVEKILKHTQKLETFNLPKKEVLLITKQKAYQERRATIKGQKDRIDILSLVSLPDFDFAFYQKILKDSSLEGYQKELKNIIIQTKEIKEISLNQHYYSKIKKKIFTNFP